MSSVFPFHFKNNKFDELVFNGNNALCRVNLNVTVKARASKECETTHARNILKYYHGNQSCLVF